MKAQESRHRKPCLRSTFTQISKARFSYAGFASSRRDFVVVIVGNKDLRPMMSVPSSVAAIPDAVSLTNQTDARASILKVKVMSKCPT